MTTEGKPFVYVSGAVGGTGKSMTAMTMVDFVQHVLEQPVALIETDTANPDVFKAYEEDVDVHHELDLDKPDGWIEVLDVSNAHPGHWIVVNGAARNLDGVRNYGAALIPSLREIGREFRTLWVIGPDRDSVELLADYREVMRDGDDPVGTLHVVTNAGRSDERNFELFHKSKTAKAIAAAGGRVVHIPTLALRVADDLRNERLSIARALETMPFGNRVELQRWRREVHHALAELDNG